DRQGGGQEQHQGAVADRILNEFFDHDGYFSGAGVVFSSSSLARVFSGWARALSSQPSQQRNTGRPWIVTLKGLPIWPSRFFGRTGQKRWASARARSSGPSSSRAALILASSGLPACRATAAVGRPSPDAALPPKYMEAA